MVGAAHVPAIRNMWSEAGTPQFEHLYKAYMTLPQQPRLGLSTTLPTIATGAPQTSPDTLKKAAEVTASHFLVLSCSLDSGVSDRAAVQLSPEH